MERMSLGVISPVMSAILFRINGVHQIMFYPFKVI